MKTALHLLLKAYKYGISPFLPFACRFEPTCSDYAREAVARHGAWRGSLLAARRLCRCHPFGGHGYDPVPDAGEGCNSPAQALHKHRL